MRLRVILPLKLGDWPRSYNPYPQIPSVNDGVAALWVLHHLYQMCALPGLFCQGHSPFGKILLGV